MLAIVIPYYKFTFFEKTLNSLARQTNKNFTVYIGDDASPESPLELINSYRNEFNIIYKRFSVNLGGTSLVQQWERCVNLSVEDWIMILGDDDELGDNVVESWFNNYEIFHEKSNVIRFASRFIFENVNKMSDVYKHPEWETATSSFYKKFKRVSRSSLSEYIFYRKSYLEHGFYNYPLAWNSDDHAWMEFSGNKPIYTINEGVVDVRVSEYNISGKRDNLITKNLSEILFYRFVISKKLNSYDSHQRFEFIKEYRKQIKKTRRLTLPEWLFIMYYCYIFLDYKSIKEGIHLLFKLENNKRKS